MILQSCEVVTVNCRTLTLAVCAVERDIFIVTFAGGCASLVVDDARRVRSTTTKATQHAIICSELYFFPKMAMQRGESITATAHTDVGVIVNTRTVAGARLRGWMAAFAGSNRCAGSSACGHCKIKSPYCQGSTSTEQKTHRRRSNNAGD